MALASLLLFACNEDEDAGDGGVCHSGSATFTTSLSVLGGGPDDSGIASPDVIDF